MAETINLLAIYSYFNIFRRAGIFEIQRKENYTKTGKFSEITADLFDTYYGNVEVCEEPAFLVSEWNNSISLAVISSIGTLRAHNIFYMNSGGYFGIFDYDHPPPVSLARRNGNYYLEAQINLQD